MILGSLCRGLTPVVERIEAHFPGNFPGRALLAHVPELLESTSVPLMYWVLISNIVAVSGSAHEKKE